MRLGGSVENRGWALKHIDYKDETMREEQRIRGFVVERLEEMEMNYTEPGLFSLKP